MLQVCSPHYIPLVYQVVNNSTPSPSLEFHCSLINKPPAPIAPQTYRCGWTKLKKQTFILKSIKIKVISYQKKPTTYDNRLGINHNQVSLETYISLVNMKATLGGRVDYSCKIKFVVHSPALYDNLFYYRINISTSRGKFVLPVIQLLTLCT